MQCLDARDLHALKRARRKPGLDDAVRDAVRLELLARLRDDLAPMRQHQDAAVRACTAVLMMAAAITVLPLPVGATRIIRLMALRGRS